MIENTKFSLQECLEIAANLLYKDTEGSLQTWEKDFIKCFFLKMSREEITIYVKYFRSEQPYYAISNLFGHKVSEIRKRLSEALGEPITRSSFIEPLRRQYQRDTQANLTIVERFINSLVYANKNINFKDLEIEVLRGMLRKITFNEIANNIKRSCRKNEVCNYIREWCKYSDCRCEDVEIRFWEKVWECRCNYGEEHIRRTGSNSLKKVSEILGVEVEKKNFYTVFKTWQQDV